MRLHLPLVSGIWFLMLATGAARADRAVLSPQASTLDPDSFRVEFQIAPAHRDENRLWFQFSSPEGIEFEFNRAELRDDSKKRHSVNIQYPIAYDLGPNPAISVGVRDLLGTGVERRSLFLALGKTIPLSDRQTRLLRGLQINLGAGSGYMGGLFAGVQARFRMGFRADAEIFRNRANVSVGLPLTRNVLARAYSLNGNLFYGLTFSLIR